MTESIKEFNIPVTWEAWALIKVNATCLEKAVEKAYNSALPQGEYIEDSFRVDHEGIPIYNETLTEDN